MASSTAHIIVEVHCVRPSWAMPNAIRQLRCKEEYSDSKYRLYVDDDLITERNWIWDNFTFLQENIWVNFNYSMIHVLKLEPVTNIPEQAQFSLQLMGLAKGSLSKISIAPTEITFKVA